MEKRKNERLQELHSFGLRNGYPREELEAILKLASNICDTPISLIDIIDEKNQRTIAAYGDWEQKIIPREKSICDRVVVKGELLIINDINEHEEIRNRLSEEDRKKVRFYAGAPIKTSKGNGLGALCVIDSSPRELSDFQKESLITLANEVMARLLLHKQKKLLKNKNERLEKYATFLKNSADILCIIDPKSQKIVDINNIKEVLGYEKDEIVGKRIIHFIKSDDLTINKLKIWFKRKEKSEKRLSLPVQLKHKNNTLKWFRCNFTTESGFWYLTARDITKQKIAENRVEKLQQKFQQIARASSDVIWEMDVDSNELIWSEDFSELFGYSESDRLVKYDWWLEKIHPDDRKRVENGFTEVLSSGGAGWSGYYRFQQANGQYRYVFDNAYIDRNGSGEVNYIVGAISDLTELKQAELLQQDLLTRIEHANHIAKLGYWEYDIQEKSMYWSDEMYYILNLDKSITSPSFKFIQNSVSETTFKKLEKMINDIVHKNRVVEFEHEISLNAEKKYLLHRGQLKHNDNNDSSVAIITTQDITKRKEIELSLSRSLQEKETLLSEIHHRVKNNLAIISGLLELELYQLDEEDERLTQFIRNSQMRIVSMAKIHELLYQSESFSHISFKNYIENLLDKIKSSIDSESIKIDFEVNIQELELNINQAIPCGLILNELITNSIKHGFKNSSEGLININLSEFDDKVEMSVSDNGVGLPSNFDIKKNKGLGITLVEIQTMQLGGELSIASENGMSCKIIFHKKDDKGSASGLLKKIEK
jgi:PAS domain S-box-containing protein